MTVAAYGGSQRDTKRSSATWTPENVGQPAPMAIYTLVEDTEPTAAIHGLPG
ncbi:MAG: hypothetical protein M3R66_10690 [Actinomycetota bacterium]|nr:hypothetical protein [Actinomycetota bacterium]